MLLKLSDIKNICYLGKRRLRSENDYRHFQEFMGELLVRYLTFKGLKLQNMQVLDLGCGFGGYSQAIAKSGGKVVGLDLYPIKVSHGPSMVKGDALLTPFPNDFFDFVICTSLIEHVPDPFSLLYEILRILRKGGILLLTFPPFYSPLGGHQFAPFHLLGEKAAIMIRRWLTRDKVLLNENSRTATFRNAYKGWGLYPLTINKLNTLIRHLPYGVMDRSTRWSPVDFSDLPIIGEFITWHVQYLLIKQSV